MYVHYAFCMTAYLWDDPLTTLFVFLVAGYSIKSFIRPSSLVAGYYCPRNSSIPYACPTGTFNPFYYRGSRLHCQLCPVHHFNHLTGQSGCFSCGGQATQPLSGQAMCTCSGNGRDFQVGHTSDRSVGRLICSYPTSRLVKDCDVVMRDKNIIAWALKKWFRKLF